MCFSCRSVQLLAGLSPTVTPTLTEVRGRQAVNNATQLPTVSVFHEVKKLVPWGEKLKMCCGLSLLKRSELITLCWGRTWAESCWDRAGSSA